MHVVERYCLLDHAEAKQVQDRYEEQEGRIGGAVGVMPAGSRFTARGWMGGTSVCVEAFHEYYSGPDTDIPQADKPDF